MSDPIHALLPEECRDRLLRIREVLRPDMEPDESWSPDHFELIAQILEDLRLPTVACKLCGRDVHERQAHRHDSGWIGPCCWDERLCATE